MTNNINILSFASVRGTTGSNDLKQEQPFVVQGAIPFVISVVKKYNFQ